MINDNKYIVFKLFWFASGPAMNHGFNNELISQVAHGWATLNKRKLQHQKQFMHLQIAFLFSFELVLLSNIIERPIFSSSSLDLCCIPLGGVGASSRGIEIPWAISSFLYRRCSYCSYLLVFHLSVFLTDIENVTAILWLTISWTTFIRFH